MLRGTPQRLGLSSTHNATSVARTLEQSPVEASQLHQSIAQYRDQVARLRSRSSLSEEQALKVIAAQMPLTEKARRADRLILNAGSPEDLEREVERGRTVERQKRECARRRRA